MTPEEVLPRLFALARRRFPAAGSQERALGPDDELLRGLGVDSVQALELLSLVEREFRIELPDYELLDVRTFRDLAERVAARA